MPEGVVLAVAGARYYNGAVGRFIGQDPVALALGDWNTIKEKNQGEVKGYLSNPQKHNSYSYAFNNPLKYDDNNGEFGILTQLASVAAYKSSTEYAGEKLHQHGYGDAAVQLSNQSRVWDAAISNPEVAGITTGVVGGAASYGGATALTKVSLTYLNGAGTACAVGCIKAGEAIDKLAKTATNITKIKKGISVDQIGLSARQGKEIFNRISGSNINVLKNGNGLSKTIGETTVILRNSRSGPKTLEFAKKIINNAGKTVTKVVKNRLLKRR